MTKSGGYMGTVDKEKRTVTFSGNAVGEAGVEHMIRWLRSVKRWMEATREKAEGGTRWVLHRSGPGQPPIARKMRGARQWGSDVPLVPITPRRPVKCEACGRTTEVGERTWRQAPGSGAGHSKARFCSTCIERGGPPRRPKLTVIRGGNDG